MAYSQAQIDALEGAMSSGALQVRYADGKMVTYRSLAEMQAILGQMRAAVAGPARRPSLNTYATYSRHPDDLPVGEGPLSQP